MNQIDTILKQEVEGGKTPSVQYAFFNKDKIIHSFRYGSADIKNGKQIHEKTTCHGFSVTKTFTALAVLQLAEQQKLDIGAPVREFFPDFPYSSSITVKHLLTHTAGIPNPIPLNWIRLADEQGSFDEMEFFTRVIIKNNKLRWAPNEKFAYSNLGYVLLGWLIEAVADVPYKQYISDQIIRKLGLGPGDLGFEIHDAGLHAKGYQKAMGFSNLILGLLIDKSKFMGRREGPWKPFRNFYVNGAAYGGLIGTADAFVRYIQELQRSGSSLLGDDYKRLLFIENKTNEGRPTGMCLSWFKGELNGQPYFTHAGGGGGFYCELRIYPASGLGSVVMFNRTGMSDERFLSNIDKYLL